MGSALGVAKTAARKTGCSLVEWQTRRAAGERWCTTCRQWTPLADMTRDANRPDTVGARCKPCATMIRRALRIAGKQRRVDHGHRPEVRPRHH